jgi:hypothetical protein
MTCKVSLSNDARLRLSAINGVLFAILKCRAQHKRHRPPPEKPSGLSSNMALSSHQYNPQTGLPYEQMKRTKKEKNSYSQTSWLEKKWRSFSYKRSTKNPAFDNAVAVCEMQDELLVIINST